MWTVIARCVMETVPSVHWGHIRTQYVTNMVGNIVTKYALNSQAKM